MYNYDRFYTYKLHIFLKKNISDVYSLKYNMSYN